MLHNLKVATFMTVFTLITTSILFAAIGTPGGNNKIPWISADSCQAGADVAFTINGVDPSNQIDYYYFGFSVKKDNNSGKKFPTCGPGASFMPDLSSPYSGNYILTQNPMTFKIPANFAGQSFYCQAIIPDPNALGGYAFSRLFEVDFFEEYIPPEELTLTPLGHYKTLGQVRDSFVHNGTPYMVSKDYGILWLDCSNPAEPKVGGYQNKFAGELGLSHASVEGSRGIVTNGNTLYCFTIGVDKSINYYGEQPASGGIFMDCALIGNYAYVGTNAKKIIVFNVSDFMNPFEVGSFTVSDYVYQLEAHAEKLFVRCRSSVLAFHLNNPAYPALEKKIEGDLLTEGMAISNDFLFLTDNKYDELLCYKNDSSPSFSKVLVEPIADCRQVWCHGGHLYVNRYKKGFYVYDISNALNGTIDFLSDLDLAYNIMHVVMVPYQSFMYAYMGSTTASLESPFFVLDDTSLYVHPYKGLNQYGAVYDLCIVDPFAVVSRRNYGLEVFDISSPETIVKINHYLSDSISVVKYGEYLYSGSYLNGIDVLRLSGQGQLSLIHHFETNGALSHLHCAMNRLFVANGYAGLQIYDLGNPTMPVLVYNIVNLDDSVIDVSVKDGLIYVLTGKSVYTFVINSNEVFEQVGHVDISSECYSFNSFTIYHDFVYICTNSYGAAIIDATDESDLRYVKMISLYGEIMDAAIFQDAILFSNNSVTSGNGIEKALSVFNNESPMLPVSLFKYDNVYNCNRAMEVNGHVLLTLDDTGVIMAAEFGKMH